MSEYTVEQVEAACEAFEGAHHWQFQTGRVKENTRRAMRRALEAAAPMLASAQSGTGTDKEIEYTLFGLIQEGKIVSDPDQGTVGWHMRSLIRQMIPYLRELELTKSAKPHAVPGDVTRQMVWSAYNLCPTELATPDRMEWMAAFINKAMLAKPTDRKPVTQTATCSRCGATEDAEIRCQPDVDDCPSCNEPLTKEWESIKAVAPGLPRYTEWCRLREKGAWSKGVPAWAKDREGRMNDHCAAVAVIEELAATIDAHIAATGEPVGYFIETSPGRWGQVADVYINDPDVVPLYNVPQPGEPS